MGCQPSPCGIPGGLRGIPLITGAIGTLGTNTSPQLETLCYKFGTPYQPNPGIRIPPCGKGYPRGSTHTLTHILSCRKEGMGRGCQFCSIFRSSRRNYTVNTECRKGKRMCKSGNVAYKWWRRAKSYQSVAKMAKMRGSFKNPFGGMENSGFG